jgi:hypothetical protein
MSMLVIGSRAKAENVACMSVSLEGLGSHASLTQPLPVGLQYWPLSSREQLTMHLPFNTAAEACRTAINFLRQVNSPWVQATI